MHNKNLCKLEKKVVYQLVNYKFKYRKIDGNHSNHKNPTYGKAGQPFIRMAPYDYKDGINEPSGQNRPSARMISNKIFDQKKPIPSKKCLTNMFWLWGQFIDHDITLTKTGGEKYEIVVPNGDKYFDPNGTGNKTMSFHRSKYYKGTGVKDIPREQFNSITPILDGSNVYGSDHDRNKFLREYCNGKLKMSSGKMLPINEGHIPNAGDPATSYFVAGDIRCNEHIGLVSMHTLFVREHNWWAHKIKCKCPSMCDEEIYQKAKIMVEAEIQAITYNEFMPLLLGPYGEVAEQADIPYGEVAEQADIPYGEVAEQADIPYGLKKYEGYDSHVNPEMSNEFSTSAYRFGHSMISSDIYKNTSHSDKKLKDTFFSSYIVSNGKGIGEILCAYTETSAEEIDAKLTDDLRNFLFGEPGDGGHDLCALNIQRGRDHGLSDYNTCREHLGLKKYTSIEDINCSDDLHTILKELYGSIDNIDLFVGGLIEKPKGKSALGHVFHKICKDQFERIRDGDSFWYKRRLKPAQIKYLNCITLGDIISRNTCIKKCKKNVFIKKYKYCHKYNNYKHKHNCHNKHHNCHNKYHNCHKHNNYKHKHNHKHACPIKMSHYKPTHRCCHNH